MSIIVDNSYYHNIAIGLGTFFLVPQIISGYRTGSLKDVSSISLIFIVSTSFLWGYYMYENEYKLYMYATFFVCSNSFILLIMQIIQFYGRFKEHVKTFETAAAPAPAPSNVVQLEVKNDRSNEVWFSL